MELLSRDIFDMFSPLPTEGNTAEVSPETLQVTPVFTGGIRAHTAQVS